MGPSGSGKSTLMHCMAGLDRPTSGQSFVGGVDIGSLDDAGLTQLRRDRVGFVFQSFNLVPTLTAGENITLPLDLAGTKVDKEWFDYLVSQLGHRQPADPPPVRVVGRPATTGGLREGDDQPAGPGLRRRAHRQPRLERDGGLLSFLRSSVTDMGRSIVMVTHDPIGASYASRVIFLADGKVVGELRDPTPDSVLERMRTLGS